MLVSATRSHCVRQISGKLPHTLHTNLLLRTLAFGATDTQSRNKYVHTTDTTNASICLRRRSGGTDKTIFSSTRPETIDSDTHQQSAPNKQFICRNYSSQTPHPPVRIACAYQGKPRRESKRPHPINTYNTPTHNNTSFQPENRDTSSSTNSASAVDTFDVQPESGEDAFFVQETSDAHYIGVADGVGGWQEMGVDPALFAWALMNHTKDAIKIDNNVGIREALKIAHEKIAEQGVVTHGSSTACVVKVDKKTRIMTVCNLGDSGLQIYDREGRLTARTPSQQHGFNFPYQLAVMPADMRDGSMMHTMADGALFQHQLEDDQILLLATDGLFDNMFPSDIEAVFKEVGVDNVDTLATTLVGRAEKLSKDHRRRSPFTVEAERHGYTDMLGGKPDDITLIVLAV